MTELPAAAWRWKVLTEWPWLALSTCFLGLTVPLILFAGDGPYGFDEASFYIPAIRQIREGWPALDLNRDSLSAVAPGYPWALAGISLVVGDGILALRLLNLLVSYILLVVLYLWLRGSRSDWESALLIAPLAASNFFVKSASWVVTDNAALLLTAASLLALFSSSYRNQVLGASLAGLATFVRQLNAWLVLPSAYRLFAGNRNVDGSAASVHRARGSLWPLIIATLSPIAVLGVLYRAWGGLVPPNWNRAALGFSLSSQPYLLTVVALLAFFYFGAGPGREWLGGATRAQLAALLGAGILVALVSPTSESYSDGRWGGYFWPVVSHLPALGDRSVFFVVLTPLGLLMLVSLWRRLRSSVIRWKADLWIVAFSGWAATFLVNRQVFHRYFEPTILLFLILAAGMLPPERGRSHGRSRLVALLVLQISMTLGTAFWRTFGI